MRCRFLAFLDNISKKPTTGFKKNINAPFLLINNKITYINMK